MTGFLVPQARSRAARSQRRHANDRRSCARGRLRMRSRAIWLSLAACAAAWQAPRSPPTSSRCARRAGFPPGWCEEKSLPIIAIRFAFDGGSAQEPAGKEGASGLLAAMLDQGAGNLSGTAYQKQMERLAARISFDSDRDAFFGNFETLTANLAKSIELLKLAVTVPTLEAATLERTRAQFLARASLEAGDANKVANAQWMAQSFAGHAYSRAIAGTPDSIKAVTRDDLDAYRKRVMAQGNAARGGRRRHRCGDAGQGAGRGVRRAAGRAAAHADPRREPQGSCPSPAW